MAVPEHALREERHHTDRRAFLAGPTQPGKPFPNSNGKMNMSRKHSIALLSSIALAGLGQANGQDFHLEMKGGGIGQSLDVNVDGPIATPYLLLMSTQYGPTALPAPHVSSIDVGLDLASISVSTPGFVGLAPANLSYPVPNIAALDGININFQALRVSGPVLAEKSNPWRVTFAEPGTFAETLEDTGLNRAWGTSTRLDDGSVLVAGGAPTIFPYSAGAAVFSSLGGSQTAQVYDYSTESFSAAGIMSTPRSRHTATKLLDGRVLIIGGANGLQAHNTAEIYDPATGTFSSTGSMSDRRMGHQATLLLDGRVLVTGGSTAGAHQKALAQNALATSELYDPATGTFSAGPSIFFPRSFHTATRIADGRVILAGGFSNSSGSVFTNGTIMSYIPDAGIGKLLNVTSMVTPRVGHRAVRLDDDRVLIVGGLDLSGPQIDTTSNVLAERSAEVINLATNSSSYAGLIATETAFPNVVKLENGDVLVTGGFRGTGANESPLHLSTVRRVNLSGTWVNTGDLSKARMGASSVMLPDGTAAVFQGQFFGSLLHNSAEVYQQDPK